MHLKLEDSQLSVSERSTHDVNGRLPAREEGVRSNFTQYPLYPRVAFWDVKMPVMAITGTISTDERWVQFDNFNELVP